MAANTTEKMHWLDRYGGAYHAWKDVTLGDGDGDGDGEIRCFIRPLGLVELGFDSGSRNFCGRADVTTVLTVTVRNDLSAADYRERMLLAWTLMNAKHSLLRAHSADSSQWQFDLELARKRRCFIVPVPASVDELKGFCARSLYFLEDEYVSVHLPTFVEHSMNVGQLFDPTERLSRMIIFPMETETSPSGDGEQTLRIMIVAAHQIADGLTLYSWQTSLIRILNLSLEQMHAELESSIVPAAIWANLPPAQEDLYPLPSGNTARRRWFWAISRILRHRRVPPPESFANPLFDASRAGSRPRTYAPFFDKILDYDQAIPLNCGWLGMELSVRATTTLRRLCAQAKVTLGAGAFALTALLMMEFEQERAPDVPLHQRKPYVASFPLDARALCGYTARAPDSVMLAFSDGITFPFLPASLPIAGRIRLLARHAHRQLSIFQKTTKFRARAASPHHLSARAAEQLLPQQFLMSLDYLEAIAPAHEKTGFSPQGAYPANMSYVRSTCGVSSVGSVRRLIRSGVYDIDSPAAKTNCFAADFKATMAAVRARPGEFLIGCAGKESGQLGIGVSYDATAIDQHKLDRWKARCRDVLEFDVAPASGVSMAKL